MPHEHCVQFYTDDVTVLAANVGRYAADGLRRGDSVLLIASADNRRAFARAASACGADVETAARRDRYVSLDARHTLDAFMVDGRPDWDRFVATLEPLLRVLQSNARGGHVRAYGEMVGILWKRGAREAAAELEACWNRLLSRGGLELFCGYPIDVFGVEFRSGDVDAVLCAHTHVVPGADATLYDAVERAMRDVLGRDVRHLPELVDGVRRPAWPALPRAEAIILWLRSELPAFADDILRRARAYYAAA